MRPRTFPEKTENLAGAGFSSSGPCWARTSDPEPSARDPGVAPADCVLLTDACNDLVRKVREAPISAVTSGCATAATSEVRVG